MVSSAFFLMTGSVVLLRISSTYRIAVFTAVHRLRGPSICHIQSPVGVLSNSSFSVWPKIPNVAWSKNEAEKPIRLICTCRPWRGISKCGIYPTGIGELHGYFRFIIVD